jgi:hypothetical protein
MNKKLHPILEVLVFALLASNVLYGFVFFFDFARGF